MPNKKKRIFRHCASKNVDRPLHSTNRRTRMQGIDAFAEEVQKTQELRAFLRWMYPSGMALTFLYPLL